MPHYTCGMPSGLLQILGPAMRAYQWNEAHGTEIPLPHTVVLILQEQECLSLAISDGYHTPAAFSQLL